MKTCRSGAKASVALALAFTFVSSAIKADDIVEVVRVDAPTNDVASVELPFVPFGGGLFGDFVFGPFVGDGSILSDRLYLQSAQTGDATNAVYSSGRWIDPATLDDSSVAAAWGDTLSLVRSDYEPFAFYILGRPSSAPAPGHPRFAAASADFSDPAAGRLDLSVSQGGLAVDVFRAVSPSRGWAHLFRRLPADGFVVSDTLPQSEGGSAGWLVADASSDADGDGLPDALESRVYGTSPVLSDTDGDGISDLDEVAWGTDPLLPGVTPAIIFAESFERPDVVPGGIAGQNGWASSGSGPRAYTDFRRTGAASLRLSADEDMSDSDASHSISATNSVVWVDSWHYNMTGTSPVVDPTVAASVTFSPAGCVVYVDGGTVVTNLAVSVEEDRWVRCTERLDYASRTWDLYVDGIVVAAGIAMGAEAPPRPAEFGVTGVGSSVDDIVVSTTRPAGLSSDGDSMQDEWEVANFGGTDVDGNGDADGDGLSDGDECAAGTSPFSADTDGDGLPDAWEVAHGLDPVDPGDADADPDGDGYPNWIEFDYGCNPLEKDAVIAVGCDFGVDVRYYAFDGAVSSMPDLSGLQPAATCVWERVDSEQTTGAWPGAPAGLIDRFAVVVDGMLLVPEAGVYRLTLESDDGAWLWVDGEMAVDNGGLHGMSSASAQVRLSAGLHELRIDYFENTGIAGLRLLWSKGGAADAVIPPGRLFRVHAPGSADSDADGMPDWWELKHGLDPADPSDASGDADSDGLCNLDEFRAGSDPRAADTDGDGLPDAWEVSHGLNPAAGNAFADPDGDGLVDLDEYRLGTAPLVSDSDGDGYGDGEEALVYFSDPLAADFSGEVVTNYVIAADLVDEVRGDIAVDGGFAVMLGRTGAIFYTNDLVLAECGVRQLRLEAEFSGRCAAELFCYVDGVEVGAALLPDSASPRVREAVFLTQWLAAGTHEVCFELRNFMNGATFRCGGVSVCVPIGPDADGNGRMDWIDSNIARSYVLRSGVVHSKVSPYCMRGEFSTQQPPSVSTPKSALRVGRLPYHGWWANVPLDHRAPTEVSVVFGNGMKTEPVSVVWDAVDVSCEGEITIRRGDTLRLTSGSVGGGLFVDGLTLTAGNPTGFCKFDSCGSHVVSCANGVETKTLTVKVVDCAMPAEVPVWRGKTNSVRIQGRNLADASLLYEHDARVVGLSADSSGFVCSLAVPAFGCPSAISCEIDNPDASVVSSAVLSPFMVCFTLDGVYHVSHRVDSGTRVVENRISAFGLPASAEIRMSGQSGICYESGAGTLILHADDFDEFGDCIYRFLLPNYVTNPCQFLHLYLDGKEVAQ